MTKQMKNVKNEIRRYLNDIYTTKESINIADEINKSENKRIVDDLSAEIWDELYKQKAPSDSIHKQYLKEAQQFLNHIAYRKQIWFKRIAITTISVAACGIIILNVLTHLNNPQAEKISYKELSTSFGEKKKLILSDGTKVMLNACSKIYYPIRFIGDIRRIKLTGEAFFEVAHDESKPFIVMTKSLSVRVLGTKFDIKSYLNERNVSVGVRQGKVRVAIPGALLNIASREEFVYNKITKEYSKKNGNAETAVWTVGNTLQFNMTSIQDAAKELERIYHCQITFATGQVFDNLISGEHENKSLESVLKSISFVTGNIKYKIEGKQVLLYHP